MGVVDFVVRTVCEKVASKLKVNVITSPDGEPYLERFYVFRRSSLHPLFQGLVPSVFLHHFCQSDLDRDLHNHPWGTSVSLILAGGYTEERRVIDDEGLADEVVTQSFKPGSLNVIRKDDYHRVTLHDPKGGCWSLFFAGERLQDWGFWVREKQRHVPWKTYLGIRTKPNSEFLSLVDA